MNTFLLQTEYIILEGSASFVTLTILRDVSIFDGLLVLEYATSDLTAKGIDEAKYRECMLFATADRGLNGMLTCNYSKSYRPFSLYCICFDLRLWGLYAERRAGSNPTG